MSSIRHHDFTAYGENVRMKAGGILGRHYEQGRFYEDAMLDYIRSLGREGVYVDIGANIGNHTVFFDRFCASSEVHAFEPGDFAWPYLQENTGQCKHTTIHNVGLSSQNHAAENTVGNHHITFDARPLDEYELENVCVVKIDIEGMECPVLVGAAETILKSRPFLFIEAHTDKEVAQQGEILEPLGYTRLMKVWNGTPTFEWRHRSMMA